MLTTYFSKSGKVLINLGFGTSVLKIMRLRGVNAPELSMPGGNEAKEFAVKRLPGKNVLVFTYKRDMYGRFETDLFYRSDERTPGSSTEKNILFFNVEIIEKKLAGLVI